MPPMAQKLQPPFALDGQTVYVLYHDAWQAAHLVGYRWHSQRGYTYSVLYRDSRIQEEQVTPDRILSAMAAQTAGIPLEVEDLSSAAGVEQMLTAHNQWRSQVNVAPLVWDQALAAYAQPWANHLLAQGGKLAHRQPNAYGENLAMAKGQRLTPAQVVRLWGDESRDYDVNRNRCTPGKVCGHYTQIVWQGSQRVGCAVARDDEKEVWVCNYDPPGNVIGDRPY